MFYTHLHIPYKVHPLHPDIKLFSKLKKLEQLTCFVFTLFNEVFLKHNHFSMINFVKNHIKKIVSFIIITESIDWNNFPPDISSA